MPGKSLVLPPNLCQEKKYLGQSIYKKDFCFRHKHGRKEKAALHSYTSLINKQKNIGETDSFRMQLSDHYKTNNHGVNVQVPRQQKINSEKKKIRTGEAQEKKAEHSVQEFLGQAPESLKKIEDAWNQEVDTGKRERGNLYGLAGKKVELLPRKNDQYIGNRKKAQVLPGLSEWLSTANEHEKRVVHSFISRLSEANRPTELSRPHSSPAGQLFPSGDQIIKTRTGSRTARKSSQTALVPSIAELTSFLTVSKPPTPATVDVDAASGPPKSPTGDESLSGQAPQPGNENIDDADGDQEPISEEMEKIETPPVEKMSRPGSVQEKDSTKNVKEVSSPNSASIQRPRSTPASLSHNCNNCEPCQKKRLMKMIDKMSGKEIASYSELVEEREQIKMNTMCTKMYRPADFSRHVTEDDYFHHGGAFQNVKPRDKGYFTIHPQFVSENIVELKKLRKKHQKHFGESRLPLF